MGFDEKWREYKSYIVMAGFLIGVLNLLKFLPAELPLAGTQYTSWVYLILTGFAAWTFYKFYWNRVPASVSIQRKIPSRNISSPAYKRDIVRQFGSYGQTQHARRPTQNIPQSMTGKPSERTFDVFKKD